MLTTILNLIGTLVPIVLQNSGVIGPSTAGLITGLTAQGALLLSQISSNPTGNATTTALASLAAISGTISVLKANTNLPADILTEINNLDADVQAALKAYATAGTGLDLSLYGQIAHVA